MNKHLFLFLFCSLSLGLYAQDNIISTNLDTIHCSIVSVGKTTIYYTVKQADGSVTGNTILLSQVKDYVKAKPQKVRPQKVLSQNGAMENRPLSVDNKCVGLKVGYSSMPFYLDFLSNNSLLENYEGLKTGIDLHLNVHHLLNNRLGVGMEYLFFASNDGGIVPSSTTSYPSLYLVGRESYRQYINFFGPSVLLKQYLNAGQTFLLVENFSAGLVCSRLEYQFAYPEFSESTYTDKASNMLLTGTALGANVGLAVEYRLNPSVSIGLGCNYLMSLLKKASLETESTESGHQSMDNQDLIDPINVSQVGYSLVLQYTF